MCIVYSKVRTFFERMVTYVHYAEKSINFVGKLENYLRKSIHYVGNCVYFVGNFLHYMEKSLQFVGKSTLWKSLIIMAIITILIVYYLNCWFWQPDFCQTLDILVFEVNRAAYKLGKWGAQGGPIEQPMNWANGPKKVEFFWPILMDHCFQTIQYTRLRTMLVCYHTAIYPSLKPTPPLQESSAIKKAPLTKRERVS